MSSKEPPSFKKLRDIATFITAIAALTTAIVALLNVDLFQPKKEKLLEFSVSAADGWQETGIDIQEDQSYFIKVREGATWSAMKSKPPHDAEGIKGEKRNYHIPEKNLGALIGRIGDKGEPFYIGKKKANLSRNESGALQLAIHDKHTKKDSMGLNDNEGSILVMIFKKIK